MMASGYLSTCQTPAQEVRLPVLAAVGQQHEPVLCVAAGVHGNEYEGQEAIRLFFDQLDISALRGAVIGLPICNVLAYDARDRVSPSVVDAANMARVFPGNPEGNTTERLARSIFDLVTRNLNSDSVFVDLHSAESTYTLLPLAGYRTVDNRSREKAERAARVLSGFHLWEVPSQPGRLNSEIASYGVTAIGTETTGGAGCTESDVLRYVSALKRLLVHMGMIKGNVPVNEAAVAMRPVILSAPVSGFLRLVKHLGDRVGADEVLGRVIGPLGEVRSEIRAPSDGLICGARRIPLVWASEPCFWFSSGDKSLII